MGTSPFLSCLLKDSSVSFICSTNYIVSLMRNEPKLQSSHSYNTFDQDLGSIQDGPWEARRDASFFSRIKYYSITSSWQTDFQHQYFSIVNFFRNIQEMCRLLYESWRQAQMFVATCHLGVFPGFLQGAGCDGSCLPVALVKPYSVSTRALESSCLLSLQLSLSSTSETVFQNKIL